MLICVQTSTATSLCRRWASVWTGSTPRARTSRTTAASSRPSGQYWAVIGRVSWQYWPLIGPQSLHQLETGQRARAAAALPPGQWLLEFTNLDTRRQLTPSLCWIYYTSINQHFVEKCKNFWFSAFNKEKALFNIDVCYVMCYVICLQEVDADKLFFLNFAQV